MSDTVEDISENKARMLRGELYFAFTPELLKERRRCAIAVREYNTADISSRRIQVQLLRNILGDETPMPPVAADEEADAALFDDDPWVEPPCRFDYGTNVKLGRNVYLNNNVVFIDTCLTTVGARTMFAPNVSVFSGGHPLDPAVRNGTKGPEFGKEIHIGEDCWIGGNVTIVPGVNIGNGAVVGAGSVVTKDVAPFTVVVGNPARKVKDVPRGTDEARTSGALDALQRDIMRTMH